MNSLLRFFWGAPNKEGYWIGPYDMYVPNDVDCVRAKDGGNILYKNGEVTQRGVVNPIGKDEYLLEYADFKDGEYYLKDNLGNVGIGVVHKEGYWVGPFDMYVPDNVKCVIDQGGKNTISKNGKVWIGTETKICKVMAKEEYLGIYADLKDGDYYLKPEHY